ncbi:MAG: hypothetical protein ACYCVG_04785 [Leptospirillum sp.]
MPEVKLFNPDRDEFRVGGSLEIFGKDRSEIRPGGKWSLSVRFQESAAQSAFLAKLLWNGQQVLCHGTGAIAR